MKKKAVFIINLISGTSDKAAIPGLIDQYLDNTQFEYEIAVTQYAGHASEIAAKAKDDGVDVVVAIGGDGTVNEVAFQSLAQHILHVSDRSALAGFGKLHAHKSVKSHSACAEEGIVVDYSVVELAYFASVDDFNSLAHIQRQEQMASQSVARSARQDA